MTTMVMNTLDQIGESAGAVWRVLDANGPLSMAQLVKKVELPKDQVLLALGWLAREEKLEFDESGRSKTISLKKI